jgi:hypothetical protein
MFDHHSFSYEKEDFSHHLNEWTIFPTWNSSHTRIVSWSILHFDEKYELTRKAFDDLCAAKDYILEILNNG